MIHLPSMRSLLRSAVSHVIEATVVPLGLFYLVLTFVGLRPALLAALLWSYAAIARRIVMGQRMSGLLVLGSALFTVRTVLSYATDSAFFYFLQPSLGNFLVAGLFLFSVQLNRPLARRLADDFCLLPDALLRNARMHHFFRRISLLWAFVFIVNGAGTVALLLNESLGSFLVYRSATSTGLTVLGILTSYLLFRRMLHGEGIQLRWTRHSAPTG